MNRSKPNPKALAALTAQRRRAWLSRRRRTVIWLRLHCTLLAAAVAALAFCTASASAETISIAASHNAWVSKSQPTTDQSEAEKLEVKSDGSDQYSAFAYLRFHLSPLADATITSASLDMHWLSTSGVNTVYVCALKDLADGGKGTTETSWSGNLTYNKRPDGTGNLYNANTSAKLTSLPSTGNVGNVARFDLTSALPDLLAGDTNDQLTLILYGNNQQWNNFASLANTGGYPVPTLNVGYEPIPEPGTLALLGMALLALGWYAWRRRVPKIAVAAIALVAGLGFSTGTARGEMLGPNGILAPTGINPTTGEEWKAGDIYHLVFVTSTTTQASSNNIATYNNFVNNTANGESSIVSGYGVTWKAIGTTYNNAMYARDNALISAPVFRLDGRKVANGYSDMWDGNIAAPINVNELGNNVESVKVFTGSSANGGAAANVINELGGTAAAVKYGLASATDGSWMATGNETKTNWNRMYALSEPLTIPIPEPGTLALLGMAVLALGWYAWRRRVPKIAVAAIAVVLACASFVQAAPFVQTAPRGASAETAENSRPPRSRILFLPRDTSPDTPEREIQEEFRREQARISGLRKPPVPGQPDDLSAYEKAARDVERTWSQRDKEYYAWLMLELCVSVTNGHIFFDDPRHGLERKYALSVLQTPDEIPLELELQAVGHVVTGMVTPRAPQGEDFARRRREDVRVRLHAWKRLIDAVDPNWDAIHHDTRGYRHLEQHRVRQWLDDFAERAESYIIRAYSKAPFDLNELGQYLDESMPDDKTTKIRILSAVKGNIGDP